MTLEITGAFRSLEWSFPQAPTLTCVSYSAAAVLAACSAIKQQNVRVHEGWLRAGEKASGCMHARRHGLPSFYHDHSQAASCKRQDSRFWGPTAWVQNAHLPLASCATLGKILSNFLCLSFFICQVWLIVTTLTSYGC